MRRLLRGILWVGGLLAAVVVGYFLIGLLLYPPTYVVRLFRYGNADVGDYRKFPERVLPASSTPFSFTSAPDEARVRAWFAAAAVPDLEAFLTGTGTQAFLVIQDDNLLYEGYFNGARRDSIVTSFSIAKSVASSLVGIAIDEGHIAGVDEPITTYVPELAARDPAFAQITIRDLLRMSSGMVYEEVPLLHGDDAKTYYYPDLRALALTGTEMVESPATRFLYNNYNPLLIGMILERATGRSVTDYLNEKLWQPMGAEYAGSWSLDSEASGFEKMESGINGRAIDFAKFGRLFLRGGEWDGRQLIPAGWVAAATEPWAAPDDYYPAESFLGQEGYYGYFWWGLRRPEGPVFSAVGNHGQFVFVAPARGLIVVRHGAEYGQSVYQWLTLFAAVADQIPEGRE